MARRHSNLNSLFQDISNSLKAKGAIDTTQDSGEYLADNFDRAILTIDTDPSGDATATAADILAPKTAYAGGQKLTGTIVTKNDSGNTTLNTTTTSKSYAAGYYPNAHGAAITLEEKSATPTEAVQTVTPTSGKVLSKVTVNAIDPYYIGSEIPVKGATTYDVSSSDRTIDGGQYLSGDQVIRGVKTSNIESGNIKTGVTIQVGDDETPGRIKNVAGTFSAANTISGTGKSAAGAGDILTGKSAFLNGAQLNGTMPNNGDVSSTITSPTGSTTIPAGYTSGGTVNVNIPVDTLTNEIISGAAFEEATGDYGWKSTVQIPAGLHGNQTLVKTFSDVFPAPQTEGTAAHLLAGDQLYDHKGKVVTGTMTNNGAVSATLNTGTTSYTVPAGYHNGSGKVSITTQTKPATPTESAQTISPDSGKVLSSVSVGAIPSNYVGSAIDRDPTMTVSGPTVTAPVGYYSVAQSKSVATTTHPNPTVGTSLDTTNHKLNITASHAQTTGYVTGGTTTASTSIDSVAGATITPSTTAQTAIAAGKYAEGDIKVAAIATETKSAYATTSAQTIKPSSGKYLTQVSIGALSNTNLSAANIKAGTAVKVNNGSTDVYSITGTFTSDANATAADIASGKTAYVNGSKITGTGAMATGDAVAIDYDADAGQAAVIYLNGKGSVAETSTTVTLTSAGTVTHSGNDYILTLADAC